MNKKILLINPWIYDFKAYDFWIKPLGLLYISSFLRDKGADLTFINCLDRNHPSMNDKHRRYDTGKFHSEEIQKPDIYKSTLRKYKRYGIPVEDFKNILENIESPDYILITSIMTYWYPGAKEVINIVKERFSKTPVILGGIYPTLCYEHARTLGADFVIKGSDINELIRIIYGQALPDDFNLIKDYVPAYDLLSSPLRSATVMTSCGCPYRCSYCASGVLQKKFYQRAPEHVASEIINYIEKFNVTDIAFSDDALLFNYDNHLKVILGILGRNNVKVNFHTPNAMHARFIDDKVASELFDAGFQTIRLGLESSDPDTQYSTGGKVDNNEFINAVKSLNMAGFTKEQTGAYVMIGLPGQSLVEVEKSAELVNSLNSKIYLASYSPIPHTQYWYSAGLDKIQEAQDPLWHNNTFQLYKNYSGDDISSIMKKIAAWNKS